MICTFFGHRDAPQQIAEPLKRVLRQLIEEKGVTAFYIGNQGGFDRLVLNTLRALSLEYPFIRYAIVLAYLPTSEDRFECETVYPEGLETVPPRYAISHRNRWLVDHADVVVTYVIHSFGGAAQFKALAEKKGKSVINLV